MPRCLIVNADDFGLTAGVSRGILEAHRRGILTSTTFMVNFPWAPDMAPMLREAPDLGVGVHLNITTGSPVLPPERVPSLTGPDGRFRKSLAHLLFRVDRSELLAEWSAQAGRAIGLLAPLGRRPTHLDTHKYLQVYPGYAEVLLRVARTYKIPAVRCLHPGPEVRTAGLGPPWLPVKPLVNYLSARQVRTLRQGGLRMPDSAMAGDFDLQALLAKIDRVGDGLTEIICHPGQVDDQLAALTSLRGQRQVELAALTAPEARAAVIGRGIQLVSFAHLGSQGQE